jgi:hypothetical protein
MSEVELNAYILYLGRVKRDACCSFSFGQNGRTSFTALERGYKASDELVRINAEKKIMGVA